MGSTTAGAKATATAKANAGILRCAQNDKQEQRQMRGFFSFAVLRVRMTDVVEGDECVD
jgi:hypothetical protein